MEYIKVTGENIDSEHICCAISNNNDIQVSSKKDWLKERFDDGLVFLKSEQRGKCFIEYIPAENAWNPIVAEDYMYIDCLWVAGSFKGHGYGADLLKPVLKTAKAKAKKDCAFYLPKRKGRFWQTLSFCSIRDLPFATRQTTVFSYGICRLRKMLLCLNSRNVPNALILRNRDMFCIIRANVRLMRNMFRLWKKRQRKIMCGFKLFICGVGKRLEMHLLRLRPMLCFITGSI